MKFETFKAGAWRQRYLLYRKPIVTAADIERNLFVSPPTANALIRDFEQLGLLQEITGQQRGRAYVFDRYLSLFTRAC